MDGQIARVIDRLKETGEYDNTLILFFCDNGANGTPPTAPPLSRTVGTGASAS